MVKGGNLGSLLCILTKLAPSRVAGRPNCPDEKSDEILTFPEKNSVESQQLRTVSAEVTASLMARLQTNPNHFSTCTFSTHAHAFTCKVKVKVTI